MNPLMSSPFITPYVGNPKRSYAIVGGLFALPLISIGYFAMGHDIHIPSKRASGDLYFGFHHGVIEAVLTVVAIGVVMYAGFIALRFARDYAAMQRKFAEFTGTAQQIVHIQVTGVRVNDQISTQVEQTLRNSQRRVSTKTKALVVDGIVTESHSPLLTVGQRVRCESNLQESPPEAFKQGEITAQVYALVPKSAYLSVAIRTPKSQWWFAKLV